MLAPALRIACATRATSSPARLSRRPPNDSFWMTSSTLLASTTRACGDRPRRRQSSRKMAWASSRPC
eukprot:2955509-Alexandrium_andersonii.AAC.1